MSKAIRIGITGMPGTGKTSLLIRVIEMLEREGNVVGGVVTEPVIERGKRTGFYIMNWITKEKEIFAHINYKSRVVIGRYGVNLDVLDKVGVNALFDAIERADIIVIDEIGKMEVESEQFVEAVKKVLDVDKPLILTLHKKSRNPLLQDIRKRDDVRILEVTLVNRNLLPYKIMKLLKGEIL